MRYILANPNLVSSARILASELDMRLSCRPLDEAPTIRWGNSLGIYTEDTFYNSPFHIANCRKDLLSRILDEDGVPCVEIHHPRDVPDRYPIVTRNTLSGHSGEGISIVHEPGGPSLNWSYWYQFKYELGVHIFNGEVIKVFKKVWENGSEEETAFPIRNARFGYSFKRICLENFKKLPDFVSSFYQAFHIGFARLDIGWDVENETYRVIECNSAPRLSENYDTLSLYAAKLALAIPINPD